jgi:hypothetical protein
MEKVYKLTVAKLPLLLRPVRVFGDFPEPVILLAIIRKY